jgi:tyrosyl-tRNA synthetase
METGISYTEFSYMAIQAYDFWQLHRTEGCELQFGGSDQWGNITAGIELIGKREGRQTYGMISPLVTNASGTKFGKSEGGNIWLDPSKTSPYEFYQFWINTEDLDVKRYLLMFTFLTLEEINEAMGGESFTKRLPQRLLARDLTARVHGEEAAEEAIRTSEALFGGKSTAAPLQMPTRHVSRSDLSEGASIVDLLVASGLASSKADARRGIKGKGFYLNDRPIEAVDLTLRGVEIQGPPNEPFVILRKGKKNYVRLVVGP